MFYEFPTDPTLAEFEAAARAANERLGSGVFARMWRGDHVIFQYMYLVNAAFPAVATREDAVLREMRGIVFDAASGRCLARRYHKFFNVGERQDHLPDAIDWSVPHLHLEKLDGMMVSPTVFSRDDVRWMTKKGHTVDGQAAGAAADALPGEYRRFALEAADAGATPIFEFVGGRRVVVGYDGPRLVLTGVRDISTGAYTAHDDLLALGDRHGVPVVKAWDAMSWSETAEAARTLEGVEGWVVRFAGVGHMAKVKTGWYGRIHRLLSSLEGEQDVWTVVLSDHVDDAVAMLPPYAGEALLAFSAAFNAGIDAAAARVADEVAAARVRLDGDRKRFAAEMAAADGTARALGFAVWGGQDPREAVVSMLRKAAFRAEARDERRALVGGARWVAPQSAEAAYGDE